MISSQLMHVVKLVLGTDIKRLAPVPATLAALQGEIKRTFSGKDLSNFTLKYYDNDGDLISVTNEEDYLVMFELSKTQTIKIHVFPEAEQPGADLKKSQVLNSQVDMRASVMSQVEIKAPEVEMKVSQVIEDLAPKKVEPQPQVQQPLELTIEEIVMIKSMEIEEHRRKLAMDLVVQRKELIRKMERESFELKGKELELTSRIFEMKLTIHDLKGKLIDNKDEKEKVALEDQIETFRTMKKAIRTELNKIFVDKRANKHALRLKKISLDNQEKALAKPERQLDLKCRVCKADVAHTVMHACLECNNCVICQNCYKRRRGIHGHEIAQFQNQPQPAMRFAHPYLLKKPCPEKSVDVRVMELGKMFPQLDENDLKRVVPFCAPHFEDEEIVQILIDEVQKKEF